VNPAAKRFARDYEPIADAIARLDLDQEDREAVATAVADALRETARARKVDHYRRDVFWLLAADPLVPCVGALGKPCPHEREIRIAMHLRDAPDGRSKAWTQRRPTVRCVPCGGEHFRSGKAVV
jgi:hypothetical protein